MNSYLNNTDFVYLYIHNLSLLQAMLAEPWPTSYMHLHLLTQQICTAADDALKKYNPCSALNDAVLEDGAVVLPRLETCTDSALIGLLQNYREMTNTLCAMHRIFNGISSADAAPKDTALLIVDLQMDFIQDSDLAITNAANIIAPINDLICKHHTIAYSRDMHHADPLLAPWTQQHLLHDDFKLHAVQLGEDYPESYMNTAGNTLCGGKYWGEHCVRNTIGSNYHPGLILHSDALHIFKGTGSEHQYGAAFKQSGASLGLVEFYHKRNIKNIIVTGLATEYCVKDSAMQLSGAGFNVIIPANACGSIHEHNPDKIVEYTQTIFSSTNKIQITSGVNPNAYTDHA